MTQDQVNSLIRSFVLAFGGLIGGWFLRKGWLDQEQIAWIGANWPAVLALLGSLGAGVWSAISRKQVNMVAAVAAMPQVNKVEMTPTPEGVTLAKTAQVALASTPAATVTIGSPAA